MKLQKEFGGDCNQELGRVGIKEDGRWPKCLIIHDGKIIGECWMEPPKCVKRYVAYTRAKGYIGSFATKKEMYDACKLNQ